MTDIVRLPQAPHVNFNRETRILRCDHCPIEEPLIEDDPEGSIMAFAGAHKDCPNPSTEASRKAAGERAHRAGFLRFFEGAK
jgi:hypothetical protein